MLANYMGSQPGKLFSGWHSVRVAGFSVLGVLSLITAVLSLLYTTAAGALGMAVPFFYAMNR